MLANYLLCSLPGTTWYFQFFFYTRGETQMGRYRFSSWTLHMASIIICSSLWGIGWKEWKGAGAPAVRLLTLALFSLVGSRLRKLPRTRALTGFVRATPLKGSG
jgi:L-rhamnose-H+ transport protein